MGEVEVKQDKKHNTKKIFSHPLSLPDIKIRERGLGGEGIEVKSMSDKIVYSTESGDLRKKEKASSRSTFGKTGDGIVRVQRESKGRGGKTVSVIYGLPLSGIALSDLAARLKQKCGSGGTVKGGAIIIQGDKVDFIVQLLQKEGFNVKRAGGT